MPMYKKPLFILLIIAGLAIISIFYNYSTSNNNDSVNIASTDSTASTSKELSQITVYVSGEVTSPGVITIDENTRIIDAVKACGDFTPLADKNKINLAQKLEDGMQVNIPTMDNFNTANNDTTSTDSSAVSANNNNGKININTAKEDDLDTLPGIGPAMAKRIIEYRNTNGNFKKIEDIKNVKGIGDAKFEKMKDKLDI